MLIAGQYCCEHTLLKLWQQQDSSASHSCRVLHAACRLAVCASLLASRTALLVQQHLCCIRMSWRRFPGGTLCLFLLSFLVASSGSLLVPFLFSCMTQQRSYYQAGGCGNHGGECHLGDDECNAAPKQAQQGGKGDGLAHLVHVCPAVGNVHHWGRRLLHLDPPPVP